ncbi:MAG: helix-turn-helix domain-containing protein, partial [Acidobacteriaceae bacterium]
PSYVGQRTSHARTLSHSKPHLKYLFIYTVLRVLASASFRMCQLSECQLSDAPPTPSDLALCSTAINILRHQFYRDAIPRYLETLDSSAGGTAICASAAGAAPTVSRPQVPDCEVIARPRRRSFTAAYKRSILDQAYAAQDSGAIGALLRREGLYSSHLTTWKRQRQKGEIDALTPQKRGPKVVVIPVCRQT